MDLSSLIELATDTKMAALEIEYRLKKDGLDLADNMFSIMDNFCIYFEESVEMFGGKDPIYKHKLGYSILDYFEKNCILTPSPRLGRNAEIHDAPDTWTGEVREPKEKYTITAVKIDLPNNFTYAFEVRPQFNVYGEAHIEYKECQNIMAKR